MVLTGKEDPRETSLFFSLFTERKSRHRPSLSSILRVFRMSTSLPCLSFFLSNLESLRTFLMRLFHGTRQPVGEEHL